MAKTDTDSLLTSIRAQRQAIAKAERIQESAVQLLRVEGVSWTVIAEAMGTTRQAARQRYGSRILL